MDGLKCLIYKCLMTKRFWPHLSSVLLLHLLVLVGSFSLVQEVRKVESLGMAPSVLKLSVVKNVLLSAPITQPRVAVAPRAAAVSTPVARPAEVSQVSSSSQQEVSEDIKLLYKSELRAEIEKHKYYPPLSRRLGQTGTVVVAFTLLEDGHIIDVRLDTPSRFEALNESAMDAVKKVHKFRPIPWGEEKLDFKLPLKFFTI